MENHSREHRIRAKILKHFNRLQNLPKKDQDFLGYAHTVSCFCSPIFSLDSASKAISEIENHNKKKAKRKLNLSNYISFFVYFCQKNRGKHRPHLPKIEEVNKAESNLIHTRYSGLMELIRDNSFELLKNTRDEDLDDLLNRYSDIRSARILKERKAKEDLVVTVFYREFMLLRGFSSRSGRPISTEDVHEILSEEYGYKISTEKSRAVLYKLITKNFVMRVDPPFDESGSRGGIRHYVITVLGSKVLDEMEQYEDFKGEEASRHAYQVSDDLVSKASALGRIPMNQIEWSEYQMYQDSISDDGSDPLDWEGYLEGESLKWPEGTELPQHQSS